jgi:hypothetical protein
MRFLFWLLAILSTVHGVAFLAGLYYFAFTDATVPARSVEADRMWILFIMSIVLGFCTVFAWTETRTRR